MAISTDPRVTLIHDWLTGMRGGEKCLEVLCKHWPQAQLYTLLHQPGSVSNEIERLNIKTSFLNRFPKSHRYYRHLLPLMPWAVSRWSMPESDLLVSFSHCVAKSVKPPEGVPHVSYCFTPMRYAWHMRDAYFGNNRVRGIKSWMIHRLLSWLRKWDKRTSSHVTHYIGISETVRQRIRECYDRDSVVIYPPVDTDFYQPAPVQREDYYLVVSAFAPYKRVDLAMEVCRKLKRRLVIIGTGQDAARLQSTAGDQIEFLGWQSNESIREHFQRCRALLFPGEEDFGIVPVEAMACGAPVIAYGKGGATETVVPQVTGLWHEEQTVDSLIATMEQLESNSESFTTAACRKQAERFNHHRFRRELLDYLNSVLQPSITTRHAA